MIGTAHTHLSVSEPDLLELALLLPRWQVLALEELAKSRGVSIGQMLRRLISELLRERGIKEN
jgi:hypothetical protein